MLKPNRKKLEAWWNKIVLACCGLHVSLGKRCFSLNVQLGFFVAGDRGIDCHIISRFRSFQKNRDTVFWGPYNKDPTICGTVSGFPLLETPIYLFSFEVKVLSPKGPST